MPTLITDWKSYSLPTDMAVVDVNSQIAAYDPNSTPLLALLTKINKKEAHNTTVEWFEDELVGRWGQHGNTTAATTGQTAIVMNTTTDAIVFDPGGAPGVVAYIPATGEQILVTSISSATLTVVRDFADTSNGATIGTGVGIVKLGTLDYENALSHTPLIAVPSLKTNIMALQRDPVTFSGSELATKKWTGDDRRYELNKLGIEHAVNIERSILFGRKKTGAAATARMCNGVNSFITSNIKSLTAALTESDMEDFITMVAEDTRGLASEWWLFAPANLCQAINEFGRNKIQRVGPADSPYGINFTRYISANGSVNIVRHWLLEESGTTTSDKTLRRTAFLLNLDNIVYRPLRGRDTQLRMNIQENDRDGEKHEYLTEFTMEVHLEKTHGKLVDSVDFT